jgi:hypothetical protein
MHRPADDGRRLLPRCVAPPRLSPRASSAGFLAELLRCVALRQCLRLRLVLLLKRLPIGACRRLLRGPLVIGCLLLLQFLPLFFLAITQLVLLLCGSTALNKRPSYRGNACSTSPELTCPGPVRAILDPSKCL